MAEHGGFAAAATVRERVLRTALAASYANGSFPKKLAADLPGAPPVVAADLFIRDPAIDCEGASGLLVLTLTAWGAVTVTLDGADHLVDISGVLVVTIEPVFRRQSPPLDDHLVRLQPPLDGILVRRWTASVLSPGTPQNVADYVVGDAFRLRLQTAVQFSLGLLNLPTVDLSFFGPVVQKATSVAARVVDGALLIGLNTGDDTVPISGDVAQLVDFAGGDDVAGVVNAAATTIFLAALHDKIVEGVDDSDATLDSFSTTPRAGYFDVRGAISKSGSTLNFSFRVVPAMFHTRPGTYFRFLPKPRWVNTRTWAALDFRIEGVQTDIDRSWWTILFKEVFLGTLTLGYTTLYAEALMSAAAFNFSAEVRAAKAGAPAARIRRTSPPPGGISVRVGLDRFDITALGIRTGISIAATPTPAALLGPTLVPDTYSGDRLRYVIRLPSGSSAQDPALRVHWIVEDAADATVVVDQDAAAGTLRWIEFSPSARPAARVFRVRARVYRRLGLLVEEVATESLNVELRPALAPGGYVRWRSGVANPQISVDEATEVWTYRGEAQVRRWSEWHRTDAPCRAVNATARYRFELEIADRLPFDLTLLENHRKGLCPYCFYGGPAGLNPRL